MKKEESNIGQLSLFDVIDGGKHGEAENVNLIKIKHKIMVDAAEFESIDEIFSGYSKLQVITFSYNWDFINKLLKYFEYVEIILGATCIVDKDSKMPYIFANATQIQKAACKYKRVSDMIQSGKLIRLRPGHADVLPYTSGPIPAYHGQQSTPAPFQDNPAESDFL